MKNGMYVNASISGDNVDPEFWSEYFGVNPDIHIRKGDTYFVRERILHRRTGVWSVSTKGKVDADNALQHAYYAMSLLDLPRHNIKNLLQENEITMSFFYYVNSQNKNDLAIPDGVKIMLDSCGIEMEFDVY